RYYSPHENWVPVDTDDYFYKGYDGESTFAEDYLQQQQLKEQDSSLQGIEDPEERRRVNEERQQ
ncbi:MAG TPA: hypothetical protein VK144_06585, partial [Bacillota bacterium]|nr:hypothetical protein [Bacillota bacterium]